MTENQSPKIFGSIAELEMYDKMAPFDEIDFDGFVFFLSRFWVCSESKFVCVERYGPCLARPLTSPLSYPVCYRDRMRTTCVVRC